MSAILVAEDAIREAYGDEMALALIGAAWDAGARTAAEQRSREWWNRNLDALGAAVAEPPEFATMTWTEITKGLSQDIAEQRKRAKRRKGRRRRR
jgi:hypothetical protein